MLPLTVVYTLFFFKLGLLLTTYAVLFSVLSIAEVRNNLWFGLAGQFSADLFYNYTDLDTRTYTFEKRSV